MEPCATGVEHKLFILDWEHIVSGVYSKLALCLCFMNS